MKKYFVQVKLIFYTRCFVIVERNSVDVDKQVSKPWIEILTQLRHETGARLVEKVYDPAISDEVCFSQEKMKDKGKDKRRFMTPSSLTRFVLSLKIFKPFLSCIHNIHIPKSSIILMQAGCVFRNIQL